MNILLTGASGQLGQELLPELRQLGSVTQVDRAVVPGNGSLIKQDLGDLGKVEVLLNRMRPDVIVNAAAYTAVDHAEDDPDSAFRINEALPARLARWSKSNDRLLVHYSTDYVFNGESGRPYLENDPTGPLGVYGASKLAGETAISASGCQHLILRTSWVYSAHGNNFVLTMLRLARERPSLSIVSDQMGCPTWARNLAAVTRRIIDRASSAEDGAFPSSGVYHYCDRDAVSWYEFARTIFTTGAQLGLLPRLPEMTAVPSSGFPQKAKRPLYSVLNVSKINEQFGIEQAGLQQSLQACIEEIAGNEK